MRRRGAAAPKPGASGASGTEVAGMVWDAVHPEH